MKYNRSELEQSFDETYTKEPEMFGHPYQELQNYFINYSKKGTVLDIGCGQGRDAIFLASLGYEITGVDSSEVGISQMMNTSKERGLRIKGITAKAEDVQFEKKFDIILFDMFLHTFEKQLQLSLLKKFSDYLTLNGILCIVFPDDINGDYFMNLLNSLSHKWKLKDKITIRDVPKLSDNTEENNFTFRMIIASAIIQ